MDQIELYISLLCIIAGIGVIFSKSPIPSTLLIVIVGMIISFLSVLPKVTLNPTLVLDVFLPLLLYRASAETSWQDFKFNFRPILLLSIGHVFFITCLVAIAIYYLIPGIHWTIAFLLGAVISPPDDVAIIAIAKKIRMPRRVVSILQGESMLNDATALIIFRFALAAIATHEFSFTKAALEFFLMLIGETLYGIILGTLIGEFRKRITDPQLQVMISFLTPFLAYLPAERLGGCGVLATVVTGLILGHKYLHQLTPEVRLVGHSFWLSLEFALQSVLFFLVGLNFRYILEGIQAVPIHNFILYSSTIIAIVIIGRFIWVYLAALVPRFLFPSIRKKDPYPPWQIPFIISWAGMRGGISLAAALAIPMLTMTVDSVNIRDLILFLVFCVIIATLLIQGLTLPWLLDILGINKFGQHEKYTEHLAELSARLFMIKEALHWLKSYRESVKDNIKLSAEIRFRIHQYQKLKKQLKERIQMHDEIQDFHDENLEMKETIFITIQLIEVEKRALLNVCRKEKIHMETRNKLLQELDFRARELG